MYEINPSTQENGRYIIYVSKNKQGQIITLRLQREEYDSLVYWTVVFWIGKRKRGYEYGNQTGRDGLKSLLWAKACLIDFMDNLQQNGLRHHLMISWDNNRRKKAYIRGLSDLGFTLKRIEQSIWLHRII